MTFAVDDADVTEMMLPVMDKGMSMVPVVFLLPINALAAFGAHNGIPAQQTLHLHPFRDSFAANHFKVSSNCSGLKNLLRLRSARLSRSIWDRRSAHL